MVLPNRPQMLKAIYDEEEKMFEKCRHALLPEENQQLEEDENIDYDPNKYLDQEERHGVEITYGWDTKYASSDCNRKNQNLIWDPSQQMAIFSSGRTLIRHEFKHPIHQTHCRLPATPGLVV